MRKAAATITLNPSVDKTVILESLVPYGLNRVKSTRLDPGGKGINAARVIQSFGIEVTSTGFIAGENGAYITDCLRRAGIGHNFLQIEGDTRVNLKIFDGAARKTTEINEQGFHISEENRELFKHRFEKLMDSVGIVVLSGSLPNGLPASFYADLISIAKSRGVKAILDADGEALRLGVDAVPYAIKPNLYELESLVGRKCESTEAIAAAAGELADRGIQIVIVSMGAEGAVIVSKDKRIKADTWDIEEQSAVGAGDSMAAALACSILNGESLFNTAKLAVAAGTITASKPGTELCTFSEISALFEKVRVSRI